MPPPNVDDLPEDVRELLGEGVAEGACWSEQPVCHPDRRVTAQLIDPDPVEQITPWRIRNADAGDLLLTPGGPAGFIGAMLGALNPPERYSHMGIFVADGVAIRHCTSSEDVLRRYPHKAGNAVAAASRTIAPDSLNEAPTDGFEESRLRFQWPGTLTQTVEDAFLSARDWGDEAKPFRIRHEELAEDFRISALTFKPVPFREGDGSAKLVFPMLVKTCFDPALSAAQRQAVLAGRSRVVRYVNDVRCHYRFFSYTRSDIGLAEDGPPMFEATMPDPFGGCTGPNGRDEVATERTAGAQCASLIWLAVQKANADAQSGVSPAAQIMLDASSLGPDLRAECADPSFLAPDRLGADRMTPDGGLTADGLYFYTEDERLKAAQTLYDALHANVLKQIEESVPLQKALDEATEGSVGKPLWIILNLLYSGIPLVFLPAMLGISEAVLANLIRFFSDIPDDVATQTVNAFASDDCSQAAKDSDAWHSPGHGETVSPDATYRNWSSPTVVEPGERVVGLWGRNVVAAPPVPPLRISGPAPSTWQISEGEGVIIRSRVDRMVDGQKLPAPGAIVRIGCPRIVAEATGEIPDTPLPAGLYWAEAWWDEPVTGVRYADPGASVSIEAGGVFRRDFLLLPPPESTRAVWAVIRMHNVNRKAIGKDWWGHPEFSTEIIHLGPDLAHPAMQTTLSGGRQIDDWGHSEFRLDITLVPDAPVNPDDPPQWSVRVAWKIRITRMGEEDPWRDKGEFIVPPKPDPLAQAVVVSDDLSRLDFWPVRSHVSIEVHNDRA